MPRMNAKTSRVRRTETREVFVLVDLRLVTTRSTRPSRGPIYRGRTELSTSGASRSRKPAGLLPTKVPELDTHRIDSCDLASME